VALAPTEPLALVSALPSPKAQVSGEKSGGMVDAD